MDLIAAAISGQAFRSKEFQDKCLTSSTHGNLGHLNNMILHGGSGIGALSGKEIPLLQLKV
ncbi:hypothetical protein DPMN_118012 [Dreissena polymorpha]|uniref:Uncharacterized protein n=1 Tax=Dreissena polymorpha TaxID=45954 RepID=A0A9D4GFP2_DREPO|nr:hypothetical protein DPMN_118012 [Dreissena polymorpha]